MRKKKADPALQYAPYKSLRGYDGMLADVRLKRRSEQRKIISEDQAAQLNQIILQLRPGMAVYGIYYHSKRYIKFSGIVRKMDLPRREMILANEIIAFSDIFELYCDALEVW